MKAAIKQILGALIRPILGYFDRNFDKIYREQSQQFIWIHEKLDDTLHGLARVEELADHANVAASKARDDTRIATDIVTEAASAMQRSPVMVSGSSVVEIPLAMAAAAQAKAGVAIDASPGEFGVALQLASLGFATTAIGGRPPATHPNLEVVTDSIGRWFGPPERASVVTALSVLGGLALNVGAQGEPGDVEAMNRFHDWLADDGHLVISVWVGPDEVAEGRQVYDDARLEALLDRWQVAERRVFDAVGHGFVPRDADDPHAGQAALAVFDLTKA